MEEYRLFIVTKAKIKPGKFAEAAKWWKEKASPDLLSDPWTKSLKCYASQFGLGDEYNLEIWQELGSYADFDAMDEFWLEGSEKTKQKIDIGQEGNDYIEWGPSRLMGDWPESGI